MTKKGIPFLNNMFAKRKKNRLLCGKRYFDLFQNALDAICFLDEKGTFIDCNNATERLTGYPRKELLGKNIREILFSADLEEPDGFMKQLHSKGAYTNFQGRVLHKNGKYSFVEINSHVITEKGKIFGSWEIMRDISERKRLEEKLRNHSEHLTELVEQKTEGLWQIQVGFVETVSTLAEYRDTETGSHLKRIQRFVGEICEFLKTNSSYSSYISCRPNYIKDLKIASILHDIGKTAIPDRILQKPGSLTAEEFEIMKTHTTIAGELLEKEERKLVTFLGENSYLALARDIAFYHHERWDGTGYPKRLRGEEIPISARIVALCDVYDALTSRRPYKEAWTHERAAETILAGKGSHFDPVVVDAFQILAEQFRRIAREIQG